MKNLTNLIILDASGSMEGKKEVVKSGLKELLAQIKLDAEKDIHDVMTATIVLDFSSHDDIRTLVNAGNSALLKDDISENYSTRGSTALYDAIGRGFAMVPEGENNVLVSIMTDGYENASREFNFNTLKPLIEAKKKLGWVITFIGTTEDAIKNAQDMGISRGNTMTVSNTSAGMMDSVNSFTNARTMYYASNTADIEDLKSRSAQEKRLKSKGKNLQDYASMNMDSLLKEAKEEKPTE